MTIIDARGLLPVHATRTFGYLDPLNVQYIVTHQQGGTGPLVNVARYHVGPNHISKRGCPGFCYHYHIALDGAVTLANDLTAAVWSSGKVKSYRADSPNSMKLWANMNHMSISIMLQGSFDAPGEKGLTGGPTGSQIAALIRLRNHLLDYTGLPPQRFIGHCHVNKRACPGFVAQDLIEDLWNKPANLYIPESDKLPDFDMGNLFNVFKNPAKKLLKIIT